MFNVSVPRYLALQALGRVSDAFFLRGPFATLRLADVPEPPLPAPDFLKIRTVLCGFCASDLNLVRLKDSPMASPFTSFPCILGHEICGQVVEVGRGVKDTWGAGDLVVVQPSLSCLARGIAPPCRVCASGRPGSCENLAEGAFAPGMFAGICSDIGGGFAEYMVAHESMVYRVPPGVSAEAAVLTEPFAVALQAVLDNPPAESDQVLIIGAGVIGALIVKAIRSLDIGCHITVVEPSEFNASFAKSSGADAVIPDGLIAAAATITGAKAYTPMLGPRVLQGGFDRAFDTVGHSGTLQTALVATAAGGCISLVGIAKTLTVDPTPLWLKLQTLRGCYASGYNDTSKGRRHAFEIALDLMARGKASLADMLTHTFALEQYRQMIATNLNKGRHRAIKTAVRF